MASTVWNGSVDTDWNTAANWTPSGVPLASAHIEIATTNACTLDKNRTVASLTVNADATLNGGGFQLAITAEGDAASGTEGYAANIDGNIGGVLNLKSTKDGTTYLDLLCQSGNIHDLEINSSGGDYKILVGNTTLTGTLWIKDGNLKMNGDSDTLSVTEDIRLGSGSDAGFFGHNDHDGAIDARSLWIEVGTSTFTSTEGVLTLDGELSDYVINNDGIFVHNSGTVTITTAATTRIDGAGASGNQFYDLKINHASAVVQMYSDLVVSHDLTILAGELTTGVGGYGYSNLTVDGDIYLHPSASAGTDEPAKLTCNSSAIDVGGKLEVKGTWNSGGGNYLPKGIFDGGTGDHEYGSLIMLAGADATLSAGVTELQSAGSCFRLDIQTGYNTTYSNGSGTVKFTSSSDQLLYSTGQQANNYNTFHNLILVKTSSTLQGLTSVGFHIKVGADLTITSGILNTTTTDSTDHDLTVAGKTEITSGGLTLNGSTCLFNSAGTAGGLVLLANATVLADADSTVTMGSIEANYDSSINIRLAGTNTINNYRSSTDKTMKLPPGVVDPASSTTSFTVTTSATNTEVSAVNLVNLTFTPASGTPNFNLDSGYGGIDIEGDLAINTGATITANGQAVSVVGNTTGAGTLVLGNSTYTGSGHLSMTGTVTIGTSGVITGVDQLGESGGTITCTGSPTLGFERWRQPTANWTPATSTLKLEGHSRAFQTNGYGVPYNLEIDNTGNTNELSDSVVVTNNLTMTAGTLDTSSSNHALTVTAQLDMNGGTLTLNGSTFELGNLDQSGGTINGNTSTINLNTGTVSGWVWYRTGGTWNYNTSTVVYKENGKHMEGEFYNLTIECASSTHTGVWRADGLASVNMVAAGALLLKEGKLKRDTAAEDMIVTGNVTLEMGSTLGLLSDTGDNTFGGLDIAGGSTFVATSGFTSIATGNFNNSGSFIHNDGTFRFTHATNTQNMQSAGTAEPTFYKLDNAQDASGATVVVWKSITVIHTLSQTGGRYFQFKGDVGSLTVTLGSSTIACTVTEGNRCLATLAGAGPVNIYGADQLKPWVITTGGPNHACTEVHYKWGDYSADSFTTQHNITIDGDMKFGAVTVASGDELDLNSQRVELTGLLSSTGTIACGTNALVVADSVNTSSTFTGNMNLIETGDGHTHTLTSSTITNWMLNGGTISNSAHGHAADNIIIATGKLDQGNNLASGTPLVNVTTVTGADLDSNTHTLTLSGDLTMSGGLIGKSAADITGVPSSSAQYIQKSSFTDFSSATEGTIECWFHADDVAHDQAGLVNPFGDTRWNIYVNKSGSDLYLGYEWDNGGTEIYGGNAVLIGPSNSGKWHHCAMTIHETNGYNVYLDGKLVKSGLPLSNQADVASATLSIGATSYSSSFLARCFNGQIGRASVWTKALTQTQIRKMLFYDWTALAADGTFTATDCCVWYQFDAGTGTAVEDYSTGGSDNEGTMGGTASNATWVPAGTYDKTNGPAIVMAGTTQDITCKNGLDIYDLTINDGSTTSIHTIDNSAGRLDVYGNLAVNEKLTSSASSNTSGITMKTAAKTLTVAPDVKTTALATLYQVVLDHGGTTDIGEMNLKLVELQSGATLRATGDFTVTTELEVGNTCALNANGKTLTCKLLDMNGASTLDLASSTLILSSTDGLTSHPNVTLNGGPAATVSGSSAATTFESQNNFAIVGNITNLNVTNEELKVTGQVINCTGDVHQYFPTIDHNQQLDADTADDRDVRLGRDMDANTELINS